MRYVQPELRDRLASEYVLGTLHGGARRRFETLMHNDRSLRDLVAGWQDRLLPLASGLDPLEPSPRLLDAIEQRIGIAPKAAAIVKTSWFERWFGLRGLGMLAAGIVVGAGVSLLAPRIKTMIDGPPVQTAQLPQSYVGILADQQGVARLLVSSLRNGDVVDLKVLAPIPVEAGKKAFLWAIPREGAPFVLGEVPATGKATLKLSGTSEQLLSKVTELGVTVQGSGAPTHIPLTPPTFILRGHCAKLW